MSTSLTQADVQGIVSHMNDDHADAVMLYLQAYSPYDPAQLDDAEMTGIDTDGVDIRCRVNGVYTDIRIAFADIPLQSTVRSRADARAVLVEMVQLAQVSASSPDQSDTSAPAEPDKTKSRNRKTVPDILSVAKVTRLSPNMIRITLTGERLRHFPVGREGANCKLFIPEPGESQAQYIQRLERGEKPIVRTYTVRHARQNESQIDIDFVAHGDHGPASRWASYARIGDFLGFRGPGSAKVEHFEADWYLVAADMSAIPMAAATLEAMPKEAKGVAIFEITSEQDKQPLQAPEGIQVHWLIHKDPHLPSTQQEQMIRTLAWPQGRVQVCVAGEASTVRALKTYLRQERSVAAQDAYISGYWKIGLVEDEHQKLKRAEADAQ